MPDFIREYLHPISCKYLECISNGHVEQAKQYYQFMGGFLSACLAVEIITPSECLNILFLYTHLDSK